MNPEVDPPLFLSMRLWLNAVAEYGLLAREALLEDGFHHKVILRKAEKSGDKGYTDWGTIPDRCWLTDKGWAYLAQNAAPLAVTS